MKKCRWLGFDFLVRPDKNRDEQKYFKVSYFYTSTIKNTSYERLIFLLIRSKYDTNIYLNIKLKAIDYTFKYSIAVFVSPA